MNAKQQKLNISLIQVHQTPHLRLSSASQVMGTAQTIKEITRENLQAVLKDTATQMVRYLSSSPNRGIPHGSFTASLLIKASTYCDSVWSLQTYTLCHPRPHSPKQQMPLPTEPILILTSFFLIFVVQMLPPECSDLLMEEYMGHTEDPETLQAQFREMMADFTFVIPALQVAHFQREYICDQAHGSSSEMGVTSECCGVVWNLGLLMSNLRE